MNLLCSCSRAVACKRLVVLLLTLVLLLGVAPTVSASPVSQESEPQDEPVLVAYTQPIRMNVRSGPGTTFQVVRTVPANTQIEIIAENEDGTWVQARLVDVEEIDAEEIDAEGIDAEEDVWLAKWLLRFAAPQTDAPQPDVTSTVAVVAETDPAAADPIGDVVAVTRPNRMNVRGGPGTDYNIVATVSAGTQVRVLALAADDQWLQVELSGQSAPVWLYRSLTTTRGSLSDLPRLSESEIPARPQAAAQPQPSSSSSASSTVVDAPVPTGGGAFGYGVQAHIIHTGQEGIVMDKTRELGFTWVKQQIEWKIFESSPGQYGFGDIGPIVGAANLRGVNLLFSVVNAPDWAREPGFDPDVGGPPADPQTYANFVGTLAREYCGSSLKAIEVWNEQNLHYEWGNRPLSAAEYMNLLRPAYAAIKAACPSMYVISGAPTPAGDNGNFAMDDFRYIEEMFKLGVAQYADGIGAHPSGYNVPPSVGWEQACEVIQQTGNSFNGACDNPHHSWSFRSTMEGYRNIAVTYGASHLRIWPTEFGWAAGGAFDPRYAYANDNSFEEQAAWTVEAFQMMKNWGWVGPAFLWNLNFRVVADGTEKAQWGIVTNDWRPLPIFHALRDMPK